MKRNQFLDTEAGTGPSQNILSACSASSANHPVSAAAQLGGLNYQAGEISSDAKVFRISVAMPPEHTNNPEQIVIHFALGPFPTFDARKSS